MCSTKTILLGKRGWSFFIVFLASLLPVPAILILHYDKRTLYRIVIAIALTVFVGVFMGILISASTQEIL